MAIPAALTPLQPTGTARPLSAHFAPLISTVNFRTGPAGSSALSHSTGSAEIYGRHPAAALVLRNGHCADGHFCGKLSGIWRKWTNTSDLGAHLHEQRVSSEFALTTSSTWRTWTVNWRCLRNAPVFRNGSTVGHQWQRRILKGVVFKWLEGRGLEGTYLSSCSE
jgi:hypothetical protein